MKKSLFAFVILLMTSIESAYAACNLSAFEHKLEIPSAEQSTLEQLMVARDNVQQTIENAETALRECRFTPMRHNFYLSSIKKLAEQFNQQVQIFRSL